MCSIRCTIAERAELCSVYLIPGGELTFGSCLNAFCPGTHIKGSYQRRCIESAMSIDEKQGLAFHSENVMQAHNVVHPAAFRMMSATTLGVSTWQGRHQGDVLDSRRGRSDRLQLCHVSTAEARSETGQATIHNYLKPHCSLKRTEKGQCELRLWVKRASGLFVVPA